MSPEDRREFWARATSDIRTRILEQAHARVEAAQTDEARARVLARAFVGALGDLAALEPGARTLYLPYLALALEVEPGLADDIKWIASLEKEPS